VVVQDSHLAVAGQRITFFTVNVDATAIFSLLNTKTVNGVKLRQLDPLQQAVMSRQLDNLVTGNIRGVRIHGLDAPFSPIFLAGTTRELDPACLAALDWFLSALEQRNLRYVLELHFARKLVRGDVPPWASPLFQECVSQTFVNQLQGQMAPWLLYDDGLMGLVREYCTTLLTHTNQFTETPIGKSNGLVAVNSFNEISITKTASWGYAAHPQLNTAFAADTAAWLAANNIPVNKFGDVEHAQYAAWRETQWQQQHTAFLRTLTRALVLPGNYFGNGPWSQLTSMIAAGDGIDQHFYSYSCQGEKNGYYSGQVATNQRSRFGAVLGGGGWNQPQFVTEFGFVCQTRPLTQDPPLERCLDLAAATWTAIAQDVDWISLYSHMHSNVFAEQSPYWTPDVYDSRVDPLLMRGLPHLAAAFHDLSLRNAPVVTVRPTNGMFGANSTASAASAGTAGANAGGQYQQFGPYTDPALYAIPAGQSVRMTT
jgi:hypothetical protein